jgi:flavodoxin
LYKLELEENEMKGLVVYDSVFGNTEKIAQAIGAVLAEQGSVETLSVGRMTTNSMSGLDILIVGSPTRGFRPTEAVSKFLNSIPKNSLTEVRVAAFDTRIWLDTIDSKTLRFVVDKGGYAANTIAKSLVKKGGQLVAPPEGFLVTGEQGPLKEGELDRANEWARGIADKG